MNRKPDYQLPPDDHSQLPLAGLGPQPGDRYRNIYSGYMLTILEVKPGRRTWLKVRMRDSTSDMMLRTLETYWEPYDGLGVTR